MQGLGGEGPLALLLPCPRHNRFMHGKSLQGRGPITGRKTMHGTRASNNRCGMDGRVIVANLFAISLSPSALDRFAGLASASAMLMLSGHRWWWVKLQRMFRGHNRHQVLQQLRSCASAGENANPDRPSDQVTKRGFTFLTLSPRRRRSCVPSLWFTLELQFST